MSRDYVSVGCSPCDEPCAQVGQEDYAKQAKRECNALIHQLRRLFGDEPPYATLRIKAFPHDFGTYHEVVCYYDEDDEESTNYAFRCENELPDRWDEAAHQELKPTR
jgi:hypothetical protein